MIAYGAECGRLETTGFIRSIGLRSRTYLLYVSRLEPENNAHEVIEAYSRVETELPLVIVGDAPYSKAYIEGLRKMADARVLFTGAVYGEGYRELRSHARAYIQATEVGGTHPALLEAMGAGNCVLARDTPEHREVLGDAGMYYRDPGGLAGLMRRVLDEPEAAEDLGLRAVDRVRQRYSWERITDEYEALFEGMCGSGGQGRAKAGKSG
jgi:glycosyltransferase involved in cell wall biosynthesis